MQTKTIGDILREEREYHRLSLTEMASRTRIRQEYLEALEKNQYHKLPAATFVKGYIKTYGTTFGFDYRPLVALLRRDYKESARGKLVPREFIKPVLKKQHFWTPVTYLLFSLVAVFGALILYIGFQWYSLQRPPELVVDSPAAGAIVSAQVSVTGRTEPDAILSINAQPVSLESNGSFKTEVFLTREGTNTITIQATDRQGKSNVQQRTVSVEF
jgi:cytoskeletal protein RodZ